MEFENFEKKGMNVELNGFIESGKQFDVDVRVPRDTREQFYSEMVIFL